jgi:cytochrome c553
MVLNNKSALLTLAAVAVFHAPFVSAADAPAQAPEADIAKGEEKSQVCVACHGQQGISQQDNYPHLHGQQQTYLLRQMHYFRDGGDRRDPIMTPMLENMSDQDLVNLSAYYASFGTVLGTKTAVKQAAEKAMPTPEISDQAKERAQAMEAASKGEAAASAEAGAESTQEVEQVAPPSEVSSAPVEAVPSASAVAGDSAAGQTKSAACAACHGVDGRGTTPLFPNLYGQKPEYLTVQLRAFRDGKRTDPTMAPMAMPLSDQDIADLAAFYSGLK